MKIEYDVDIDSMSGRRGGAANRSPEYKAIEAFVVDSTKKNVCFTYDEEKQATGKANSLRTALHRNEKYKFLKVSKRGKSVIIEK